MKKQDATKRAGLEVSLRSDAIGAYYASNKETLDAPQSTYRPCEIPPGRFMKKG